MDPNVIIEIFLWLCLLVALASVGLWIHESIATARWAKEMRRRDTPPEEGKRADLPRQLDPGAPLYATRTTSDYELGMTDDETQALLAVRDYAEKDPHTAITIDMVASHMSCSRSWAGKLLLRLYHRGYIDRVHNGRRVFYFPV